MTTQKAVRELRESMGGISQEKLARQMDVTLRTVARYEDETEGPGRKGLIDLYKLAVQSGRIDLAETFKLALYTAHLRSAELIEKALTPGLPLAGESEEMRIAMLAALSPAEAGAVSMAHPISRLAALQVKLNKEYPHADFIKEFNEIAEEIKATAGTSGNPQGESAEKDHTEGSHPSDSRDEG